MKRLALPLASAALGAALVAWGGARGFYRFDGPALILVALALALCAWVGLIAVRRQLRAAASRSGSYLARHAGLAFGVAVWSGWTYWMVRRVYLRDRPGTELSELFFFELATFAVVAFPIWMWVGALWHSRVDRALEGRRKPPRA